MPGFDGTGPMGAGSMTGGARGFCNPAYAGYGRGYGRGRGFRRGFGPGLGWGRGYGRGFGGRAFYPDWGTGYAPASSPSYGPWYGNPYGMNPQDELHMLRDEADAIKSDLEGITKRIQELA
jgi:hypothetical protein